MFHSIGGPLMSKASKSSLFSSFSHFSLLAAAVVLILLMLVNSLRRGEGMAEKRWGIPSFWTFSNYASLVSHN